MSRVKRGVTSHARHKKVLAKAKGYYGRRKNTIRVAKQAVTKAGQYAYRDRRARKRNFRAASGQMRQLTFGKMDLSLHLTQQEWSVVDIDAFLTPLLEPYQTPYTETFPTNVAQFGHLFSGPVAYASGYYSYKWAEVLDADAFSRFKNEGIFNATVGREYRNTILSRGNTAAPDKLFRDFMGRDPDPEALLRRTGLLKDEA